MGHFFSRSCGSLSHHGKLDNPFKFLKMATVDLEQDSKHLSTLDCHNIVNIIQCCLFSERIFAGDYVLKK